MVGASPDNIGAQRLAEGGVPTSGAGSEKNWNLTPITKRAQKIKNGPKAVFMRGRKLQRFL